MLLLLLLEFYPSYPLRPSGVWIVYFLGRELAATIDFILPIHSVSRTELAPFIVLNLPCFCFPSYYCPYSRSYFCSCALQFLDV